MFKYKVECVGWEYRIYRKKHWFGLWQDAGIIFTNKQHAEKYVHEMNSVGFSWEAANADEVIIRIKGGF